MATTRLAAVCVGKLIQRVRLGSAVDALDGHAAQPQRVEGIPSGTIPAEVLLDGKRGEERDGHQRTDRGESSQPLPPRNHDRQGDRDCPRGVERVPIVVVTRSEERHCAGGREGDGQQKRAVLLRMIHRSGERQR